MTFRFYNASPGDWVEGANEGHRYELCFEREPTSEEKARIAARYENALAQGPATTARASWKWSGPFAHFMIGERWIGHPRAAFAKVADLVRSFDRIVPLAHAAFLGAFEAPQWPTGRQPPPGADASRPVDDTLPRLAADEAFEAARADARAALGKRKLAAAVMEVDGLSFVEFPLEKLPQPDDERSVAAKRVFEVPDPLWIEKGKPPRAYKEPVDGDHPLALTARAVAYVKRNKRNVAIAYETEGERRLVRGFPDNVYNLSSLSLSHDGSTGLVCVDNELWEIDFETGAAKSRWGEGTPVTSATYLPPRWIVKTPAELIALDPSGDEVTVLARMKLKEWWAVYVALEGAVVAVSVYSKGTRFVGYCEGKLKTLAKLPKVSGWVAEIDGEIVFVTSTEGERQALAVRGLDALYDAWSKPLLEKAAKKKNAKKAPKKTTKKRAAEKKAELVELPELPQLPPPPQPPLSDEDQAETAGGYIIWAQSGAFVGATPDPDGIPHTLQRVSWKVGGQWQHAKTHHLYPQSVSMSPDEALVVITGQLTRAAGASLAVNASDGSIVPFRFDREKPELGNPVGYVPLSADEVVVNADKGVEWWKREGDGFVMTASVKVGGLLKVWVDAKRRLVLCRSKNKQKLLVFDDSLKKRGAFTEALTDVRVTGDAIYVLCSDRKAWRLDV